MIDPIITKNEPITLVGGANLKPALLHLALEFASHAVGADGGADALCKLGKDPLAVIGDMDSDDIVILNMCGRGDKDLGAVLPVLEKLGRM